LVITSRFAPAAQNYDVSLVATRVPLSIVAAFARHARKSLPDDFTATGDLTAAFGFHSRAGVHDLHGTGMTTPFLLQAATAEKAFPVSSIRFHVGPPDTPGLVALKKKKKGGDAATPAAPTAAFQPSALTIDAFSVQMGPSTTLELQGNVDSTGYFASA